MSVVAQVNRKSLRVRTQTGHHSVPGREIRKSQKSCRVPVYVLPVDRAGEDTHKHVRDVEDGRRRKSVIRLKQLDAQ